MSDNIAFKPNPGIQEYSLRIPPSIFEVLFGGSRGGGKTQAGLYWLLKPINHPKYSHTFLHPQFRALVLRRNSDDLSDWLDRAYAAYKPFGVKLIRTPHPRFVFPSGAVIRCGHLKDKDSYTKYQGHEYQRILIEELTQIPREIHYDKVIGSCRSTVDGIPAQVFLTTNPGGKGHCIPYGDVLTSAGWKPISEAVIGDTVASMDDNGELIYQPVKQVFTYDIDDELITWDSDTHFMTATTEHKVIRRTETKNKKGRIFHKPTAIAIGEVPAVTRTIHAAESYSGAAIGSKAVNRCDRPGRHLQPTTMSGDQYCSFMGWFLSEGYTLERDKMFGICQVKPDNRVVIKQLLDDIGFVYSESATGFAIYSSEWYDELQPFGRCRDKFVPADIKGASTRQLRLFWEAAMMGDGHGNIYYTTSLKLADDMQEIGLKLGYDARIRQRQRSNRQGLSYEVVFRKNRLGWMERKSLKREPYKGKVYCIGVPNHRFFVRQQGTVWLSGNSWVRDRFIKAAPPKTRFRNPSTGRYAIYLPATVDDNPKLMNADPDYVKWLDALKQRDINLWKAWRNGDWNSFEGQIFSEWMEHKHVVTRFDVPLGNCRRIAALDWGYNDPTSVHWLAETPEDSQGARHIYVYRELHQNKTTPLEWAEKLGTLFRYEPVDYLVLPHDCFSNQQGYQSVAQVFTQTFAKMNVEVRIKRAESLARGSIIRRVTLMHQMLATAPDGKPFMQVHQNCQNFITTIGELVYDEDHVEEIADGQDDHAFDSVGYGLMALRPKTADARFINSVATPQRLESTWPVTAEGEISPGDILSQMNDAFPHQLQDPEFQ